MSEVVNRYAVKEMFRTIQGEGSRAGAVSVFLRFSGCNLWSGIARLRETGEGPCAHWCDTKFASGEPDDLENIVEALDDLWPLDPLEGCDRWVVLTGGEPMLQVNADLVHALQNANWFVALETNGTLDGPAVELCDHVCVSPKRGVALALRAATELKVVLPGAWEDDDGWKDEELSQLACEGDWSHLFVQPQDYLLRQDVVATTALVPRVQDGVMPRTSEIDYAKQRYGRAVERCLEFVNAHPAWRLSLQTNKFVGMP